MKLDNSKRALLLLVAFLSCLLTIETIQAAPGDLDPMFGNGGMISSPGFSGNALAVQADGKILASGDGVERYNPDGSLDAFFGTDGRAALTTGVIPCYGKFCFFDTPLASAIAIQADGKIVAVGTGSVSSEEGMYDLVVFALWRYNTDGSPDNSFGTGGRVVSLFGPFVGNPSAVAIQSDGKIVVTGYKRSDVWDFLTARYNTEGSLDASFGSNGTVTTSFSDGPLGIDEAKDVAIQSDGKIVVVGKSRENGTIFNNRFALVRYIENGSADPSFGTGGKVVTPFNNIGGASSVAIQSNGKIVAAGPRTARYNTDGSLDTSFAPGGAAIAIQPDGKIIAVDYGSDGINTGISVSRSNPDGSPDLTFGIGGKVITPFNPGGGSRTNDLAIQADGKIVVLAFDRSPNPVYALFRYQAGTNVSVNNIEELYSAVNNPQNAGSQITIAPGLYMLSVNEPGGMARPNGGRLELQENMSLQGVVGDRGAVVIDAIDLPTSSYDNAPPVTLTAAIRMGRGSNSIEWLTARNAVNGNANIGTDLASQATNIRVAHVASTHSQRGLDVRNFGAAMAGRIINAEIIDNDFYDNRVGTAGEGVRIASNNGANGGIINATLSGNRHYNNYLGLIVDNNQSSHAVTKASSSGDRFFENGLGTVVLGGLSQGSNVANANTVSFTALGSSFENNNGLNNFDRGGLLVIGGENTSIPNGTSDNTVNVKLRGCRFGNNQFYDLAARGARSKPETVGLPGTNNRVKIRLTSTYVPVLSVINSAPSSPGDMNTVMLTREWPFDFDGDGKTDIGVLRESGLDFEWWINRSGGKTFATRFGRSTGRIAPADYTGDGRTDIALFQPSSGEWYVLRSEDYSFFALHFGSPGDIPVPADYDDDGKADFAVFRRATSTWYISQSDGAPTRIERFGVPGDRPVAADYDGDGKADIAIFRPGAFGGEWWIQRSTAGLVAMQFGTSSDMQVQGDYTGDGKADIAIWRPSTGEWFIVRSEDFSFYGFPFGTNKDIVAPGDYDGDGKFDATVFRPLTATWFVAGTTAGTQIMRFGSPGDRPLANAFVP